MAYASFSFSIFLVISITARESILLKNQIFFEVGDMRYYLILVYINYLICPMHLVCRTMDWHLIF